ncbi:MAG: hypothetical protein OEX81_02110 [Candidatus Pacebacteria bacterium]|nr:hypothetical protein [Candidatus Paceibacterota bacterium]
MSIEEAVQVLLSAKSVEELNKGGIWLAYRILCEQKDSNSIRASYLAPRAWIEATK